MALFQEKSSAEAAFARVKLLFDKYGLNEYIGEPVSIIDHCLQAANFTAQQSNNNSEMIAANLLHDLGYLIKLEAHSEVGLSEYESHHHEAITAHFLRTLGFNDRVCTLTLAHVQAKRFMCYQQPEYLLNLSEASRVTLSEQGGAMSAEEADKFQADPDFHNYLQMRACYEAAKVPVEFLTVPGLDSYKNLFSELIVNDKSTSGYALSDFQTRQFETNGYLVVEGLASFADITANQIQLWCDEVMEWPTSVEGKWISQHKTIDGNQPQLYRNENVVNYHKGFAHLTNSTIQSVASQLLGERAVLLRDNINHKLRGDSRVPAHQGSRELTDMGTNHVLAMMAIDDISNEDEGCLQMCKGQWNCDTPVPGELEAKFDVISTRAGDVVFFGGYTPHRSSPNTSSSTRRGLFLCYNPVSQGNFHDSYYITRRATLSKSN